MENKLCLRKSIVTLVLTIMMLGNCIAGSCYFNDGTIVKETDMLVISTNDPTVSIKAIVITSNEQTVYHYPLITKSSFMQLPLSSIDRQSYTVWVEFSNGTVMKRNIN